MSLVIHQTTRSTEWKINTYHMPNSVLSANYLIDYAWAIMVHTLWLKPDSKQGVDHSDEYRTKTSSSELDQVISTGPLDSQEL